MIVFFKFALTKNSEKTVWILRSAVYVLMFQSGFLAETVQQSRPECLLFTLTTADFWKMLSILFAG